MSGPLKIGENFATTLYGQRRNFTNTRSIKIVKKVKIKINFPEIFLDIGAVDKFYFLMYQRTI